MNEHAWELEIYALLDKEVAENQILAAKIEFLDARYQTAVLRVWRRAAHKDSHGDGIEELRSLVRRGDDGELRCYVIQGSRLSEKGERNE